MPKFFKSKHYNNKSERNRDIKDEIDTQLEFHYKKADSNGNNKIIIQDQSTEQDSEQQKQSTLNLR